MNGIFMRACSLIAVIALLAAAISGCVVNPVTGKAQISWISEFDEIEMGRKQYLPSQQSQGGVYRVDPEVSLYVAEIGQRVASVSDRQLPYEFVVLNNSSLNAWALPGGKIGINRGLLLELKNEAELAAVLGHEAVHAAAKHGANSWQRGQIIQGLVLATQMASSQSEYGHYIVDGAQIGAQLITQNYGRRAELQADYYGIKYMSRAGYDPRAAVSLQKTLMKLSNGKHVDWLVGLFASHPPSQARVDANLRTIKELQLTGGRTNESRYASKMAYLRQTKPAYDKFDEALAYSENDQLDMALAAVNIAIEMVPEEARFQGLKGDIYYQTKRYQLAKDAYNRAVALDDNYFEYYLGRGLTNNKQGNRNAARLDLQRSNQLLPTAIANHALGKLSVADGDKYAARQFFSKAMKTDGDVGKQARLAFALLDISDNPARYITVDTQLTSTGYLIATLENTTAFNMTGISVEFSAIVNRQVLVKVVRIASISADRQMELDSGWRFRQQDLVENISTRVISAQVEVTN